MAFLGIEGAICTSVRQSCSDMHHHALPIWELLRKGAEHVLQAPAEWLEEVDAAALATLPEVHPATRARVRRSNRLNIVHWASSVIRAPDKPVQPNLSPEMIQAAAEHVHRMSAESVRRSYRAAETAAWLKWMEIVFTLTADQQELRLVLDVSMRSISGFVEATVASLLEQAARELDKRLRGSPAERLELIRAILAGQFTDIQAASLGLGYRFDQTHQAVIIWQGNPDAETEPLERLADTLVAFMNGRPVLRMLVRRAEIWIWLPRALSPDQIRIVPDANLKVALGPEARGMDGFKRSHAAACVAQRLSSEVRGGPPIIAYDAVRLIAVLSRDRIVVQSFIREILGDLAASEEELQRSLLTYLELGCHVASAAAKLGVHRNTLMRQISRAEDMLPVRLFDHRIEVAVALRAVRFCPTP